jgi:hypothetical protein
MVAVSMYIATGHNNYLKIRNSSYQYQHDKAGKKRVFRYDYLRKPSHPHPACHLQIRGDLIHPITDMPLERIHFPTRRISLETVIRLLVDQFEVPCNSDADIWRRVLAEGELLFMPIAHEPDPDMP